MMVDIDAAAKRIGLGRFNIDDGDVGAYGDWTDLPFIRATVAGFVNVSAEHWELMAEIWIDGYLTGQWRTSSTPPQARGAFTA